LRRLLPALAVAQAAGILAADGGWLRADAALGLGLGACGLALALGRRPRARVALCLVAAAAGGALALARQLEAADATRPARALELTLEATVREAAASDPATSRVELEGAVAVEPAGARIPPRVRLWLPVDPLAPPGLERALPGQRIRARVRLAAPGSRRNPGAADAALRARRAGIGAVGRLADPSLVVRLPEREGPRPLAPVHALRARAGRRLAALGSGGDLLRALALGEQGALAAPLREAFAALGISHLLSVSGLHLVLVAALAFGAARRALARAAWLAARRDVRGPALGLAVAAAAGYTVLAGGAVPVRRSLALLVALAVAAAARRPGAWGSALAAASVWILAVEPEALFDPGAQLSFAGSAALASRLARGAAGACGGREGALADGLRTSATALLATAPIAALHFGRSAPFALLANAVAVPWTGFVLLPGALASAGLALAPSHAVVDGGLALAAAIAAASLRACVALASWLPAPVAGAPPGALGIGLAAALAAAGLWARSTAARVSLASALGAVLALAPPAAVAPGLPRVVFLDVGQGDAALVQSAGAAILVDAGGGSRAGRDAGLATVVPALRALGVRRLDLLVVSHADLDHRGGAPAVLGALPVGEVWVPLGAGRDPAFAALRDAARSRRAALRERGAGSRAFERDGLRATPIWPAPGAGQASRNDRSLVVRVEVAGRRVLLPGDLEAEGEAALLAAEADLRADVLKLPHHGSRTSSTPAFLDAVGASVAVASAPCAGRFGMPHREVVRRARASGAALWWTGRDGAVRIGLGPRLHALGTGDPRACASAGAGTAR
jgi:competence protein ComEC